MYHIKLPRDEKLGYHGLLHHRREISMDLYYLQEAYTIH